MLLAYIVESLIKKTKRLKLVEVVQLLREITNVEMDLDLKLLQLMNFTKIQKMTLGLRFQKFIGTRQVKKFFV